MRVRINSILKRLEKVQKQRDQGRRSRNRSSTPTLSLVGYTNAGKSTLFNYLTEADVYAADQMFATLDPTLRRIHVSDVGDAVLADTVGFIRHLPHKLVDAFKATLQETIEATLLLHVIDCATDDRDHNIEQVTEVLTEIGADRVPQLQVYNKIDLLEDFAPFIERDDQGRPVRVWCSAKSGVGTELIFQAVSELLADELVDEEIRIPPQQGQLRALLFEKKAVLTESYAENGDILLHIRIQTKDFRQLLAQTGIPPEQYLALPTKEFFER